MMACTAKPSTKPTAQLNTAKDCASFGFMHPSVTLRRACFTAPAYLEGDLKESCQHPDNMAVLQSTRPFLTLADNACQLFGQERKIAVLVTSEQERPDTQTHRCALLRDSLIAMSPGAVPQHIHPLTLLHRIHGLLAH